MDFNVRLKSYTHMFVLSSMWKGNSFYKFAPVYGIVLESYVVVYVGTRADRAVFFLGFHM